MEPNNLNNLSQTSFIPKQSLAKSMPSIRRSSSLFTVVAVVILVLSLALWGLGFAFQKLLFQEINNECTLQSDGVTRVCGLRVSLATARESLGEGVLKKIQRLDLKLQAIDRLLADHVILTPVFDNILSPLTIQSVQYKKFAYVDGVANLEGVARSYKDIAVQSNKFAEEKSIKSFIFSDLDLDNKGNIVFKLKVEFDPALIRYSNYTLIKDAAAEESSLPADLPSSLPVAAPDTATSTPAPAASSTNSL
jgi:hypothetical protein